MLTHRVTFRAYRALIAEEVLTSRGHIHAFWILYKKMRAEELYGQQGYIYVGNGEYVGTNDRRECLASRIWVGEGGG